MNRDFNVIVKDAEGHAHLQQVMKWDRDGLPILEDRKDGAGNTTKVHAFEKFAPMTLRQYALDTLASRGQTEELSVADIGERIKLHDRFAFALDGKVQLTAKEGEMIVEAMNKQKRDPIAIYRIKVLIDTDPTPPAKPAEVAPAAEVAETVPA